jgi:hypothetical protein
MSTLKVTNIEHGSTTDGGIQLDSDGHVTIDGQQLPTTGALSNRNLIINGACRVNQRGTTPTITANTFGPVDHFETRCERNEWQGQLSQETVSVNNEFTSCLRVKTTTAETTVDGTNQITVETHMEGQDLQHLFQGTSGAKPLTLSFWVRSSQTGTYVVKLYRLDGSNGRMLNKTYTINSANTWEYKTFTFAGDTSGGAIPNTVNEGMRIGFQLATGSGFTSGTQPTTWTAYTNPIWAAGHVENSFMTTVNATWDVTGVQLEVGEKATPFEHRSYGDELARCQRYYQELDMGDNNNVLHMNFTRYSHGSGNPFAYTTFPVQMRAAPSFSFLGETFNSSGYTGDPTLGSASVNGVQLGGSNSASANATHYLRPNNDSGDFLRLTFNAEL